MKSRLIASLGAGLEYARECLQVHDTNLGRTTYKNRVWAETIERDIRMMEESLSDVKELDI